jgi:hypothetical protein
MELVILVMYLQALQPFSAVAGIRCFRQACIVRAIVHCRKCVADAQSVPHDHRRCACCTILKQDVEFQGDSALCKVSVANFAVVSHRAGHVTYLTLTPGMPEHTCKAWLQAL